jgi:hypothetical protein
VEKSNWTGFGVVCSRAEYPEARLRQEYGRPGVYLLIGPALDGQSRGHLYIGEADELRGRVDQHAKAKDFWTEAMAFTSKDANLNKAHVRYLEARLIGLAKRAKRAEIENGTEPPLPHLSEADRADMETYLDELLVVLPLLGVGAFEIPAAPALTERATTPALAVSSLPKAEPRIGIEPLFLRGPGDAQAQGAERAEGFVVFEGAAARAQAVPSTHAFLLRLRDELIKQGLLSRDGNVLRLTQHHIFESPSTAAGVLLGRAANGRIEWKDGDGRTLKELQESALEAQTQ